MCVVLLMEHEVSTVRVSPQRAAELVLAPPPACKDQPMVYCNPDYSRNLECLALKLFITNLGTPTKKGIVTQ
jgi:hypothetical protein